MRMREGLTIEFNAPTAVWSINEVPSTVRAKIQQSKNRKEWRYASFIYACQQIPGGTGNRRFPVPANVGVTLTFPTKRTRDGHNYTGTVIKPIVDGLVDAGVFPNDSPEYVTVLDPVLTVDKGPQKVIVRVTPRGER